MSAKDLMHDLYMEQAQEIARLRDELNLKECQLIYTRGQRSTLFMHLRLAANCLTQTYPHMAAGLHSVMADMESFYDETMLTLQSSRATAGDSQHPHGPEKPENAAPVQAMAGETPYYDLPDSLRSQQWDR